MYVDLHSKKRSAMVKISGTLAILVTMVFNIAEGMLKMPKKCSIKHSTKFGGLFANCSGRNLQQPPHLNASIVAIDLSFNKLNLTSNDFNYPFLVYLNLSHNDLRQLLRGMFNGCEALAILDVGGNNLMYNNLSYPLDIFKPLRNLQVLNLGFNKDNGVYLEEIFYPLANLQELSIDTFTESYFGRGFRALASLRVLNFSQKYADCSIEVLHNDTLSGFRSSNITIFDMSYCKHLTVIEADALAPLIHLKSLILKGTTGLGLHGSLLSLYALQGTNMTTLDISNVIMEWTPPPRLIQDGQLFAEQLQYLENICVSELNLSENHIMYINLSSLFRLGNTFSTCLKHVDVHGNWFYGYYQEFRTRSDIMRIVSNLSVEYIDLSGFVCYHGIDNSKDSTFSFGSIVNEITWYFPKKLKTVIADALATSLIYNEFVSVNTNNVLETISICKYNEVVLEGTIKGFVNVKTIKITHNKNMTLSASFFDTFPSLENLYLNYVSLPRDYFYKHGKRLLSNLTRLRLLDLSGNGIRRLSKGTFSHNHNLQSLILSNNLLRSVPIIFHDCPRLLNLNLDNNKIETLDRVVINSLENYTSEIEFSMDLSENRFSCLCHNLYFVFWLQQNNYTYDKAQYSCITEQSRSVRVMEINAERLWNRCTGRTWLSIAFATFPLVLLLYVSSFFVIKHKTQTIYFFKNLIRKCVACPKKGDFEFDVCLCYAEKDWRLACLYLSEYLERKYGYNVYLHDRNSIPGDLLAHSIMYGINNSWKTIILLTENFLEDGWSWFTMQVAIRVVTWRTPHRLIILKDSQQDCEIPNCVLCVVDDDSIVETPHKDRDKSWEDLVHRIQ